mgnify:CR=1 FL=1
MGGGTKQMVKFKLIAKTQCFASFYFRIEIL